jgi:hypothetical protein
MPECKIFENHIMLGMGGRRRACCRSSEWTLPEGWIVNPKSEEEYQNLPLTREVKSVMKSGDWHSVCQRCRNEERRGIFSMRQSSNRQFSGTPGKIESLEFTISNRCNLSCRSCGHTLSTTWQDYINNNPWYPIPKKNVNTLNEIDLPEIIKWMEGKDWNDVKLVKVAGGEPMMSKKFFDRKQLCQKYKSHVHNKWNILF